VLLQNRGLAASRTKAQALILAGVVQVGGKIVSKPGTPVIEDSRIEIIKPQLYVSRGGEKLAGALDDFHLNPAGLICLDVGASTGGFTDCLLQRGAQKVIAVDVGKGQLMDSLRRDARVVSMEKTHILELDPASLERKPGLITVDVSFISLKRVLPKVKMLLPEGGTILALVKPQFEVGAKFLKKGVVRDEEIQKQAVREIIEFAKTLDLECVGQAPSKLKGPKGNQEYFILLKSRLSS